MSANQDFFGQRLAEMVLKKMRNPAPLISKICRDASASGMYHPFFENGYFL
jgi:hypothetical protein